MSPRRPASPSPGKGAGPRGGAAPSRPSVPRTGANRVVSGRPPAPRTGSTPVAPRSATRPASSRPASRGSAATPPRGVPRTESVQVRVPRLFTVRVMVLGVVSLLAFVLVFPTLRSYLAQRVELEQLHAKVAEARQRNEDLEANLARWDDEKYVIAQARDRLAFVLPGETAYRVRDPEVVPPESAPEIPAQGSGPVLGEDSTQPWYAVVWESVRIAGEASLEPAPDGTAPATGENGQAPADGEPVDPAAPAATP
jgi:cell division protein FtsB